MTTTTTLLRNGTIYDGAGSDPTTADILISGDRIAPSATCAIPTPPAPLT